MPFGFEPLTPLSYLDRSAVVFGDRLAVVDGDRRWSYAELGDRCKRMAGAIRGLGVEPGDRVSVLAPNTVTALEAHYGVPGAGAVLNALNFRLSAPELAYIVDHVGSKLLLVDEELVGVGREVAQQVPGIRMIVVGGPEDEWDGLRDAAEPFRFEVTDEMAMLSINYTSGTTGRPKGVVYSHRGGYLQALAMIAHNRLGADTVFLWTLPMFHCNGWCYTWAITGAGGVHVALRKVDPADMWQAVREEGVTHFNGTPTVLTSFAYDPAAEEGPAATPIQVATGGAPHSPTLIARLADLNVDLTHLYGLTETYGPAALCEWRPEWDAQPPSWRARMKARQGVGNYVGRELRVVDGDGVDVPDDAEHAGEILVRGNHVMLEYYRDPDATREATLGEGWFRTGDVAVMHSDGYIEIRDRAKDVIISGGENIASIEVEQALASHHAVLESAVVAAPDEKWGEVPVAFVVLKAGASATEDELVDHVKSTIARFKAPKRIVFGDLPKTATGKIQKFVLRERLWAGRPKLVN